MARRFRALSCLKSSVVCWHADRAARLNVWSVGADARQHGDPYGEHPFNVFGIDATSGVGSLGGGPRSLGCSQSQIASTVEQIWRSGDRGKRFLVVSSHLVGRRASAHSQRLRATLLLLRRHRISSPPCVCVASNKRCVRARRIGSGRNWASCLRQSCHHREALPNSTVQLSRPGSGPALPRLLFRRCHVRRLWHAELAAQLSVRYVRQSQIFQGTVASLRCTPPAKALAFFRHRTVVHRHFTRLTDEQIDFLPCANYFCFSLLPAR